MKELGNTFPRGAMVGCVANIGAGQPTPQSLTYNVDPSQLSALLQSNQLVAHEFASQCHELGPFFFRLAASLASPRTGTLGEEYSRLKGMTMTYLNSQEAITTLDGLVEALVGRPDVLSIERLESLAGKDGQSQLMARVQKVQQHLDDSIFRDINFWLKPIHQTSKLDANTQARGEFTCQWILRDPTFIQWLEAKHGLFWYHGLMGTGKTVAISFVIETLLAQDDIYVAYYYFEFTNPQTLSEEAFYRSLVAQLAPAGPSVMRNLHQKHNYGGHQPLLSTLKSTLIDLVSASPKPVYIFLDALDELPSAQRKYLLQSLIVFCRSTGAARTHVMTTSREDRDIRETFDGQIDFHLGVQGDLVRQDIAAFVDQRLAMKKWSRWPEEEVQMMRQVLNERADGQFRMVACQVDILTEVQTSGQLYKCLHSLPKTLASTYEYILNQIPHDHREAAQMVFAFLAFNHHPVSITELCALIAVDFGDESDPSQLPVFQEAKHFRDPLDLLNLGASFLSEVKHWSGETAVQLAHASVKEYLLMGSSAWLALEERAAHNLIASACLAVLLHFQVLVQENRRPSAFWYAYHQWHTHVLPNCSPALLRQQQILYVTFPWSGQKSLYSGYGQKHLLASVASFGLVDFLECCLATNVWDPDALGAAMFAAAASNHPQYALRCCRLLTFHGASVDCSGDHGNALHIASMCGKLDVAQFLIEAGADVNAVGGEYGTPLQAAASAHWADVNMIRLLVQHGANVNTVGGEYGTALQAAMANGNLEAVKFLVQAGAVVNFMEGVEESTYFASAWSESLEIIQFLVHTGIDVNGRGEYGTSLQAAARAGRLDIAQFLVQNGADVNAAKGEDGTALHAAASQGHLEVVKFLIQEGADMDAMGADWPILEAAAGSKSLETVQFLVEKGANVDVRGGLYGNALQAAAQSGSLEVARLLVQEGADVKALGGMYWTALQAAAQAAAPRVGGSIEIVQFLVQEGADVNAVGGRYGTALQAAVYGGNLEIIKFLVQAGADVNAVGGNYGTALQAANQYKLVEIAQFLLQMGADANIIGGPDVIPPDPVTLRCWNKARNQAFKRRKIIIKLS
ncbi:ankyrin repeat-containing domain protein [Flagelloscypha sp. PMI_526]|nr:ankyrin repeat-containing domain protein [Flagelloscypha sp. PMI_526]